MDERKIYKDDEMEILDTDYVDDVNEEKVEEKAPVEEKQPDKPATDKVPESPTISETSDANKLGTVTEDYSNENQSIDDKDFEILDEKEEEIDYENGEMEVDLEELEDANNPEKEIKKLSKEESQEELDAIFDKIKDLTSTKINIDPRTIKFTKKTIKVDRIKQEDKNIEQHVLWNSERGIAMEEINGYSLSKISEVLGENGDSTYSDLMKMYTIIYNSIKTPKPKDVITWLQNFREDDEEDLFFAVLKANFKNSMFTILQCIKENKPFLRERMDIDSFIEVKDEYKEKYDQLLNSGGDLTNVYQIKPKRFMISNKYIIDIKPRSIWNNVETTLVPKEFFNKYLELINIISYIKDIWVIQEDGTASRIDYKSDIKEDDSRRNVKIYMNKIRQFGKVLTEKLSTKEYNQVISKIININPDYDIKDRGIRYIYPEYECPTCGEKIEKEYTSAKQILFIRHQQELQSNMKKKH